MDQICNIHNCKLEIKWYAEGTPHQDFDGFYCPICQKEHHERINDPAYKAWREMERKQRDFEKRIRMAMEFVKETRDTRSWESINMTCESMLRRFF